MFCGKSRVARYSVEFDRVWGVPNPDADDLPIVARMFCGKSRVARYSVEFDRVWGVPNPGVDDLPTLLGCFAVSRA